MRQTNHTVSQIDHTDTALIDWLAANGVHVSRCIDGGYRAWKPSVFRGNGKNFVGQKRHTFRLAVISAMEEQAKKHLDTRMFVG